MASRLDWKGEEIKRRVESAQKKAVNATMAAAIIHAKSGHGAGAHAAQRFVTRNSDLERSIRITQPAKRNRGAVAGRWGSIGLVYARRIELGFQGKDAAGRVVDAPAYPFLAPAAQAEYGKLGKRIRRAL